MFLEIQKKYSSPTLYIKKIFCKINQIIKTVLETRVTKKCQKIPAHYLVLYIFRINPRNAQQAQQFVIPGEQNLLPGMSLLDNNCPPGTSLLHNISLAGTSLLEKFFVAGMSLENNYCLAGTYLVEGFVLQG